MGEQSSFGCEPDECQEHQPCEAYGCPARHGPIEPRFCLDVALGVWVDRIDEYVRIDEFHEPVAIHGYSVAAAWG